MLTIQKYLNDSFEKNREKIFLRQGENFFTYGDLKIKTNQILAYLKTNQNTQVVIIQDKDDFFTIAGILASIYAKKVFFILDERNPEKYKQTLYQEIEKKYTVLTLNQEMKFGERIKSYPEKDTYQLEDDIYLYGTSGTSGQIKLVVGKNGAIVQNILWQIREFKINSGDKFLRIIPYSHDGSLRDIFLALFTGASLVALENKYDLLDARKLKRKLVKEEISRIHCTPSILTILLSSKGQDHPLTSVKSIFLSGENPNLEDVRKCLEEKNELEVVNFYGPTEATMIQFFHRISRKDLENGKIPLGQPLPGYDFRLKEEEEGNSLCISSKLGVLRYVEKDYNFWEEGGRRWFNTGDLVKKKHGELYYIGRKDKLLKIRGNRVHLQTIEESIRQKNPEMQMSLLAYTENHQQKLVLFLVSDHQVDAENLRKDLKEDLPSYITINQVKQVNDIPLTKNLKVDKKKLLASLDGKSHKKSKCRETKENILRAGWEKILNMEGIQPDSDFFLSGADSLDMVELTMYLQEYGYYLDIKEIIDHSTFKEMLSLLRIEEGKESPPQSLEGENSYPLLPIQKEILEVEQILHSAKMWQLSYLIEFKNIYQLEDVERAIKKLVEATEVFHLKLKSMKNFSFTQTVEVPIVYCGEGAYKGLKEKVYVSYENPLYFLIFKKEGKLYCASYFHHLYFDEKSFGLWLEQLNQVLQGKEVPLTSKYRKFLLERKEGENQDYSFWLRKKPETYHFEISLGEEKELKKEFFSLGKAKYMKISNYAFLLAVTIFSLKIWEGKKRIGLHTFLDLRPYYRGENTLGLYTQDSIFLLDIDLEDTLKEYFKKVAQSSLDTINHNNYNKNILFKEKLSRNSILVNYTKATSSFSSVKGSQLVKGKKLVDQYGLNILALEKEKTVEIHFLSKSKNYEKKFTSTFIEIFLQVYSWMNAEINLHKPLKNFGKNKC